MQKGMEYWAAHVAAVQREAISVSAYAKREGVSPKAMYYWQRKLKAAAMSSDTAMPGSAFIALRVADRVSAPGPAACTVILASGMRLEMGVLPAPDWLAELARATVGVR